ncbi:MAG: DUF559 domain-containing protein [Actinobacteria bacterium]|nr:DUF559 domain-containing protein [Actinomycetota bacterium]
MFRRSDLASSGASRAQIDQLCKESERLRRDVWIAKDMDPWERHDVLAGVVLSDLQPSAMLTGPTAAYLLGLPRPKVPPGQIFVRGVPRGAYGDDVKVLGGAAPMTIRDGVRMADPAVVVADCARCLSARDSLAIADAATHQRMCGVDDLADVAESFHGRHGVRRVAWLAENVDPAAESPGETWTCIVLTMLGYAPTSQVVVRDAGRTARVDFLLEDGRTIVEFDGLIKYQTSAATEVNSEKDRQAWLESLGYVVVRVLWKHLADPETLAARLARLGAVPTGKPMVLPAGWHLVDPVRDRHLG